MFELHCPTEKLAFSKGHHNSEFWI